MLVMSDLLITPVQRFRTDDGQEFATIGEARAHAVTLMQDARMAKLQTALDVAGLLEQGNISLAQFNARRDELAALLRWLVKRIVRG